MSATRSTSRDQVFLKKAHKKAGEIWKEFIKNSLKTTLVRVEIKERNVNTTIKLAEFIPMKTYRTTTGITWQTSRGGDLGG